MNSVKFDFTGETVLVTGAARGIGRSVAQAFAAAGGRVSALDRDEELLTWAEKASVSPVLCDITDSRAVAEALAPLGHIDVLVNNAGIERVTPIVDAPDVSDDDFARVIDTNVTGTYGVTRQAVPHMGSGGRIVITSSIWGRTAVAEFSAYCASKHAVIGFTRCLAQELGPHGIRVNAVCPGWVRTRQSMATLETMAERSGRKPQDLLDEIAAAQALPGLMEPDDVSGLYLFLASVAAADITGQAFVIDRGEVMA